MDIIKRIVTKILLTKNSIIPRKETKKEIVNAPDTISITPVATESPFKSNGDD